MPKWPSEKEREFNRRRCAEWREKRRGDITPKKTISRDNRRAAIATGDLTYDRGYPCKLGGHAPAIFYVSNRECVACALARGTNPKHLAGNKKRTQNYREKHPSRVKQSSKKWAAKNAHTINAKTGRRRAKKKHASVAWANESIMKEMYQLARIISDATGIPHDVDHIVPLRSDLVCGLHWEINLQIIPASDNSRKGNRHWPDMA
jgi:hypothetical protein